MIEVDLTLDFERLQLFPTLFLFLKTQYKNMYRNKKISKHNIVTKKGEGKRNKPEQDGDGESLRDREEKMTQ